MRSLLEDVPPERTAVERKDGEKKEHEADEKKKAADAARLEGEKKKGEAEKPITVRKRPAERRPDLPTEPPAPAARQAAEPAERREPEPEDESDFEAEEKEMISDLKEAETLFPDQYKGLEAKGRAYVKAHIKFIKEHGGDANFDPENPEYAEEYQRFLEANQPRLSRSQLREIAEARVERRVQERIKPELETIRDQRFADNEEPKARQVANEAYGRLAPLCVAKEIQDRCLEVARAKGVPYQAAYNEVYPEYKLELDTVNGVLQGVAEVVHEFERITRVNPDTGRPLARVAEGPNDPKFALHQRIEMMIHETCEDFKKNAPIAEQKKGDKWFVTKAEWLKIKRNRPDQIAHYWTFSNKEIVDRALKRIPDIARQAIASKLAEQQALGFVRKPREEKKEAAKPFVKSAPAAPHPSPVPAGAGAEPETDGSKLAKVLRDA